MITQWLVRMGLWLAKKGGWTPDPCARAHADVKTDVYESAQLLMDQVDAGFPYASGEFKRREVIRAMMNRHPSLRTRELALTLELAFQDRP
jgi:hypothetical protein